MNCKHLQLGIEQVRVCDLSGYAGNSRTHSDAQVEQIAASIREFGFVNPVLVGDDDVLIAGHGRLMASELLGLETVPAIRLGHLSEEQQRALVIADNQIASNAGWDETVLVRELSLLDSEGFDLDLIGFDPEKLADLLGSPKNGGIGDPEKIPDVSDVVVSKLGFIWELGNHRLLCGDSQSDSDINLLMRGQSWDTCVFDPPYELESLYHKCMPKYDSARRVCVFWDFKRFAVAASAAANAGWKGLYEFVWDNVTSWYTPNRPLARHKTCGIFGDDPYFDFDAAIIKDGKQRKPKQVKNTRGTCDYKPLDGAVHIRTVESFPTTQESGGHAHSKPIAWIEAIFNGVGGAIFLDLFGGSGSTIIACEKTRRRCYTIEIDPKYCDVIVKRWQDYTGKDAVLEGDGRTFNEIAGSMEDAA